MSSRPCWAYTRVCRRRQTASAALPLPAAPDTCRSASNGYAMRWLAILVGLIIAALGILGIAAPTTLLDATGFALTKTGLYVAAALRVVFGLVLIAAAAASRLPKTLRVLGALIVVAGVITPFFGLERARAMVDWWSAQGPLFMRAWAALAVIFGLFIVYAVTPRRPAA
jgi:hypothetical protein